MEPGVSSTRRASFA